MIKVLLCSPYLSSDDVVKGGINTWGRYIMEYSATDGQSDAEIVPVSFDRFVSSTKGKSIFSRLLRGLQAYKIPVKKAISSMKMDAPDVLHLCTSAGFGLLRDLVLLRKAKRFGIKTVAHFHFGRIPELREQNNWEWKLIRNVIRHCDTAVVMNRPSEETLLAVGFTNVRYLPNPLAMNVLKKIEEIRDRYNRIPRRLLYAGHVIRTKGVYELVEACSQIPNIELRIVGKCTPEVESDLKTIASKNNDGTWMNIVGEVDHDTVLAELLQADMFVFPSYTEGFPNVILEAMACGCPIVSSDVGAIPEMLDIDGTPCGICFESRNSQSVQDAILALLGHKERKADFVFRAYNRIETYYTISKVWENLINIWRRV